MLTEWTVGHEGRHILGTPPPRGVATVFLPEVPGGAQPSAQSQHQQPPDTSSENDSAKGRTRTVLQLYRSPRWLQNTSNPAPLAYGLEKKCSSTRLSAQDWWVWALVTSSGTN